MTPDRRTGDLLPEHLVEPAGAGRRAPRRPTGRRERRRAPDGQAPRSRLRDDRVPDRHEPERRPEPGLDQAQARRARRRLRRHGRHRPGLEDRPHPDRRRRARRPLRLGDDGQLQHRLLGGLHRARSPRAARSSAATPCATRPRRRASGSSTSPPRSSRSRRTTSRSSTARCWPRARRTARSRSPTSRAPRPTSTASSSPATGTALKPLAEVDDDDGSVTAEPHSAISYAACVIDVEVDDETGEIDGAEDAPGLRRRPRDQPDARRGPDRGRRDDGPRARPARGVLSRTTRRSSTAASSSAPTSRPSLEDLPEIENVILENPSVDGPFGAKAIGEMANNAQPPAIAAAIHDAVGVWVTEMPATPERVLRALEAKREPRREGKRVIFDEEISVAALSADGGAGVLGRRCLSRRLRHLERRRRLRVRRRRAPARHRRRPGPAVPGRLRARQAGPAPRARAHRAAHGGRRGLGDDDDRRRDARARPRRRRVRQPRHRARAATRRTA